MKDKFEDYLMEIHAKQYIGLDDEMSDDYEKWVSELDCNDIIEYAGKAIEQFILSDEQKKALRIISDFVERWNKQDKEKEVAQAVQDIANLIKQ